MGILINIVCAEADELEAVGMSAHPVEEWGGFEVSDIDTAKLATLHCLLVDDDFETALGAYEPVFISADEGAIVLQFPDNALARLASLDEDALDMVSEELAAADEFEVSQWGFEDVQTLVMQLAEVARLADSQGQVVLVWIHGLQDN